MAPGLALVFFPMLPAIPYMFGVTLIFYLFEWPEHFSAGHLAVLGLLVVISILNDHLSGIIGAKYGGASGKAILAGIAGLILGLIFFPPLGGFAGLFIGVLVYEISHNKKQRDAFKAAAGALIGSLTAVVINFFLALLYIGLFIVFALA